MESYNRLPEYNIKPFMQRIVIMSYLMEYRTYLSADEIYAALSPPMPTLSRIAVYNTPRLFSEQGAAQMPTVDERNTNFDGDISQHAHFSCKRCGHTYDLECQVEMK